MAGSAAAKSTNRRTGLSQPARDEQDAVECYRTILASVGQLIFGSAISGCSNEYSRKYQERTHAELDATLARGGLFGAYLSTFPNLSINHAVLVYARKPVSRVASTTAIERYLVYDPNHPEASRELT